MPRGVKSVGAVNLSALLPADLAVETVLKTKLVTIKAAASLGGVHPVVLEVAQKLLSEPTQGAQFTLATPEMQAAAHDIERMFVKGIRATAKKMGHGATKVRSHLEGDRLIFWLN